MGIPETKKYNKLIIETFLNVKAMGKPSMNPKFKKEFVALIEKYYPNWEKVSYNFKGD